MADTTKKTYREGMLDGIALYGRACAKVNSCESCPIGSLRGTNVTCAEFCKQFPGKALSILKEMDEGTITYYEEYGVRFPDCNLSVEDLAEITCRKVVFEGYLGCEDSTNTEKCIKCWKEKYMGDTTVFEDEEDTAQADDVIQ